MLATHERAMIDLEGVRRNRVRDFQLRSPCLICAGREEDLLVMLFRSSRQLKLALLKRVVDDLLSATEGLLNCGAFGQVPPEVSAELDC
eukprot:scaffold245_cov256-Pinguiococcus_pyrenoidosus.AAC.40